MGCGQSGPEARVDSTAPGRVAVKDGLEKPVSIQAAAPDAEKPAKAAEAPAAAEAAPKSPAPVPAAADAPAEAAAASGEPAPLSARGASTTAAAADETLTVPAVPGEIPADSTVLFVLGGPGSGKGTQCDKIKERYAGIVHLSAGDLLRAESKSGSEVGQKCQALMTEGKLVPLSVTIGLLKNAMISSGGNLFLVDGFPRATDQAVAFESTIMPAKAVLFFDCTNEEMEKRLMKRGETSGRADDNAETILKRFKTFVEESLPVKELYLQKGNAIVVDSCFTPDEVFENVKAGLDKLGLPIKEGAPASPPPQAAAPASPAPAGASARDETLVVPAVPGEIPADSTVLFVLGGPGSGKGTQCDKIKERYAGIVHLSAGDLLRAESKSGSEVGQKCQALMTEGKLVPLSVTIGLLKNAMISSGGNLFLVDGFPRATDQAVAFESTIMPAKAVLFFDCTNEEMEKRLLKRGETSGRADDNAETILKRFKTFVEESLPVKELYLQKGNAIVVDSCKTPDEVFEDVKAGLDKLGLPMKEGGGEPAPAGEKSAAAEAPPAAEKSASEALPPAAEKSAAEAPAAEKSAGETAPAAEKSAAEAPPADA